MLPPSRSEAQPYRAGTLTYSRSGLVALFAWLLLGDFVFNFMEIIASNFIPLRLKQLAAPNWLIGMVITTVPSILGMTISPLIGVSSDRTRTRWGRRLPYLLGATPFITLTLMLIGMSDALGVWLQGAALHQLEPAVVILWLVSALVVMFQFLNVFITNIYIYLFNDVVPRELFSRFMALFKIVGITAAAGFQFFLFGKAETHMREIFVGGALLYGVVFTTMCLRVREGQYEDIDAPGISWRGLWDNIRSYAVECFSHRIYWYFFLANMFWNLSFAVVSFRVFFAESVGLTLDEFGRLMGGVGLVSSVLLYPAASLADRYHPIRVMLLGLALLLLVIPLQLVFLAVDLPSSLAHRLYALLFVLHITVQVLCNAALMPLFMKILPRERFGQFFSASGLLSSAAMICAGVLSGIWLDWLQAGAKAPLYQYRYLPVWVSTCLLLSFACTVLLYQKWKQLGGDHNFQSPA